MLAFDLPALAPARILDPITHHGAQLALVAVDVGVPHLDRLFDYLIPASMSELGFGMRVKVMFAGKERDGWVLGTRAWDEREDATRALAPIRRLVSPVATLTPAIAALARSVADRYVGTLSDVLRFAVPPRHARAEAGVLAAIEKAALKVSASSDGDGDGDGDGTRDANSATETDSASGATTPATPGAPAGHSVMAGLVGGDVLLQRMSAGEHPRAVWTVTGGPRRWREGLTEIVQAARAAGRGVLIVVPDVREVDSLASYLGERVDEEIARLVAGDGPSVRARAHLRVLTGLARIAIGTRAAAWAPVMNLGLMVCLDDGDDSLREQRAPYPHAAQVLAMRAEPEQAALVFASAARTAWAQHLVATGWAASLREPRNVVRLLTPRVSSPDEQELAQSGPGVGARIPTPAWRLVGEALKEGPVLVSSPRSGYVPLVVCSTCRAPASCGECGGSLHLSTTGATPSCSTCGHDAVDWRCKECSGTKLRAARIGSMRTAEELGRAFPQVPVQVSAASPGILSTVDAKPRIIVATPGAEPEAQDGYAGALLLDASLTAAITGLAAGEETLRRWLAVASLVRDQGRGGRVMVLGGGAPAAIQALVRWDPVGFAERELAERAELHFPPTARVATLTGPIAAVGDLLDLAELPSNAELLGPYTVATPDGEEGDYARAVVRAPLSQGAALSSAIKSANGARSAHKRAGSVRVVVDPRDL